MPTGKKSVLVVMTVPEAGAKLGLGRNASYDAARRGEIPAIRIGKLIKVPKVAFDRMLSGDRIGVQHESSSVR